MCIQHKKRVWGRKTDGLTERERERERERENIAEEEEEERKSDNKYIY